MYFPNVRQTAIDRRILSDELNETCTTCLIAKYLFCLFFRSVLQIIFIQFGKKCCQWDVPLFSDAAVRTGNIQGGRLAKYPNKGEYKYGC